MKKTLIFISLILIISSFEGTKSKANVTYWFSDQYTISGFDHNDVTYRRTRYSGCNMVFLDLIDFFNHGIGVWDDELDVDFSFDADPDVDLTCISRAEAEDRHYESYWVGAAGVGPKQYAASYPRVGEPGYVVFYTHNTAFAHLIWDETPDDGTTQSSHLDDDCWKSIAAHEFGHALGFKGHNTEGDNNLMHSTIDVLNPVLGPQIDDIQHMEFRYGLE
jgi:hypothetical protein